MLYEFKCYSCENKFERIVKNEKEKVNCPECGSFSQREFVNSLNFVLKGSGWAKDGYNKRKTNDQTRNK